MNNLLENIIKPDNRLRLIAFVLIFAIAVLTFGLALSAPTNNQEVTDYFVEQEDDQVLVTVEQSATDSQVQELKTRLESQYPDKQIVIDVDYPFSEDKIEGVIEGLENFPPTTETDPGENPNHGAYDQ